jgi:hypothetical protein
MLDQREVGRATQPTSKHFRVGDIWVICTEVDMVLDQRELGRAASHNSHADKRIVIMLVLCLDS